MLSRVADNLYWMSRYLERAEHTARLLDVNLALALEQSPAAQGQQWGRLLTSLRISPNLSAPPGGEPDTGGPAAYAITRRLTSDRSNSSSVIACVQAARENARQVREQISSEMWEQINRFYLTMRGATSNAIWRQPHEFLRSVKEGIHFFQGLTDSTLGHDEGWQFIQVGRYLERAVATSTLLGVYYEAGETGERAIDETSGHLEWVGLLKSCTGFEAYCRAYTADLRPDRIAEFLLLDPAFPHSVRFSVDRVNSALRAISEATGCPAEARVNRLAGRLQAALRFSNIQEIMADGLNRRLADIEEQCLRVHDAIFETYIAYPIERAITA